LALTPSKNPVASDDAFVREVDDAVRASDLTNFWTRYGRWLLAAVVAGLLAFGGYILWQNRVQAAADKQSEAFVAAIDKLQAGDDKGARVALAKLAKADQPGYRAMAQLVEANLDGEKGDMKKAIAAYGKVAADSSLPKPFRDLALVRQTSAEFDTLPPQKVIDRLKSLAIAGDPWFGSAGEMTAMAYIKLGKDNLAGPIFAQIAKQQNLPQSQRARATQMAGALGVDAVQLDEKKADASEDTAKEAAPAKGDSK
jgi:hypothetical protein